LCDRQASAPRRRSALRGALRLVQVNFFDVVRMTNAVLPLMRARRSGKISNMSSSGA
jgi:short-subunit dehydrogenase